MAIDISGSGGDDEFSLFFNEIHHAWKAGTGVVECDAKVQTSNTYQAKAPKASKGGGCTDFNPVFEWAKTKPKFDAIIYLMDGKGTEPEMKPTCSLL
ncbi:MAG: hypothetical protein EBT92_18365 [Planctomycetes bacterium]|nr:hypothetical protein [Planctomycetota bacterium]